MSEPFQLNLLANAFDYFLSSAEHARQGSPRNYKYAVVHLAMGVELLLKARLRHEHWSLLFADVDRANKAALQSGTFKSVDFETCLRRLGEIAEITVSQNQVRHLRSLIKLRNRTVHFDLILDEQKAKSLIARGCNIALDFYDTVLKPWEEIDDSVVLELHENLREFEEFVGLRLKAVRKELEEREDILECPRCWQETLIIGAGDPYCPFCQYVTTAEDLAAEINEGGPDLDVCPNCGQATCCLIIYNNDESGWYCTSCGVASQSYERCVRCDALVAGDSELCSQCADYLRHY